MGTDLTALVLNGLGATTGSSETKSALAAASGGIIGAQGIINKDLFYQKTVPAIITQMEANRSKVKLAIFQNLKQADSEYPLQRADMDLEDLNNAGSLPNAISSITQVSSEEKAKTQAAIQASFTYATTTSAKEIRAWLYSDGKVNQDRLAQLQNWLDTNSDPSVHGLSAAALATGDDANSVLKPLRQRALGDSTLNIPH